MTRFGGGATALAGAAKVSRKGSATRLPPADRRKERRVDESVKNWLIYENNTFGGPAKRSSIL